MYFDIHVSLRFKQWILYDSLLQRSDNTLPGYQNCISDYGKTHSTPTTYATPMLLFLQIGLRLSRPWYACPSLRPWLQSGWRLSTRLFIPSAKPSSSCSSLWHQRCQVIQCSSKIVLYTFNVIIIIINNNNTNIVVIIKKKVHVALQFCQHVIEIIVI